MYSALFFVYSLYTKKKKIGLHFEDGLEWSPMLLL